MLFPFLFQLLHGKPFEQFLSSFEIGFEGGQEQTLSEPSGAAHEVRFADVGDAPHQCGLVHVQISLCADVCKCLYSDGKLASECYHTVFALMITEQR